MPPGAVEFSSLVGGDAAACGAVVDTGGAEGGEAGLVGAATGAIGFVAGIGLGNAGVAGATGGASGLRGGTDAGIAILGLTAAGGAVMDWAWATDDEETGLAAGGFAGTAGICELPTTGMGMGATDAGGEGA